VILKFEFENFSSYRDPQSISWVASSLKHPNRTTIAHPGVDHGVLPCCAIYGANASGKSNALAAFRFFCLAVLNSFRDWPREDFIGRNAFRNSASGSDLESRFQLDFSIDGTRYQYGFAINDVEVVSEWLNAYPSHRKQIWFQREKGKPSKFGDSLKGNNRTIEELTKQNVLFLTLAAMHGHERLEPIYSWFRKSIVHESEVRFPGLDGLARHYNGSNASGILAVLKAADLGIVGADLQLEDVQDPPRRIQRDNPENAEVEPRAIRRVPKLKLLHEIEGQEIAFPTRLESEGTRILGNHLPYILRALRNGGLYVVDEIDRSLHPSLCLQIMNLFLSPKVNSKGAQLLFTTHDPTLLSSGDLRRDEVWFAEKKPDGASILYPLSDFSPRKNENLERGYLQGRYGAVPLLNPAAFWSAFEEGDQDGEAL